MGKYRQIKVKKSKTIDETLREAESDHIVDCPNASLSIRLAAGSLDAIFLILMASGLERLFRVAVLFIGLTPDGFSAESTPLLFSIHLALQSVLLYFYWIRTVIEYGGTPAKLLLKLRVVDSHSGNHLGFYQAVGRELLVKPLGLLALGFGLWMALTRKDGKTLHDVVCHTTVKRIYDPV